MIQSKLNYPDSLNCSTGICCTGQGAKKPSLRLVLHVSFNHDPLAGKPLSLINSSLTVQYFRIVISIPQIFFQRNFTWCQVSDWYNSLALLKTPNSRPSHMTFFACFVYVIIYCNDRTITELRNTSAKSTTQNVRQHPKLRKALPKLSQDTLAISNKLLQLHWQKF